MAQDITFDLDFGDSKIVLALLAEIECELFNRHADGDKSMELAAFYARMALKAFAEATGCRI